MPGAVIEPVGNLGTCPAGAAPSGRRILLVATNDSVGGMQQVVISLARGLQQRNWHATVAIPRGSNSEDTRAWWRDHDVDTEQDGAVRDAAAPHTLRDLFTFRRFIRSRRPDVVNLHYGDNFISIKDVIAVRLAGRVRCVVSVHHPTPWRETGARKRRMTRLAAMLAHVVVVNSEATRQVLLEAGVPASKLRLIPCGVEIPKHLPNRWEARERLGLPQDAFIIGTLARLLPHKGIGDLIRAVARLSSTDQQTLVIAGEGPERESLERLAAECLPDGARFLGHIAEAGDLYAASDVFALPSYLEGFGLVYLEAALYAVPSIGTRVGGVPEAIREGETGLLVRAGDIPELTEAIRSLREDPALRMRLGQAARAHVYQHFTEDVMADRYERTLA